MKKVTVFTLLAAFTASSALEARHYLNLQSLLKNVSRGATELPKLKLKKTKKNIEQLKKLERLL